MESTSADAAWCAADPHFTAGDPALPVFHRWLDGFAATGPRTLVLLGDLFAAWVALPAALSPVQREAVDHFSDLARAGRHLVFLVGNRDYFVEALRPAPFAVVAERWDLELPGGGRIRFEHGDLVNMSDRGYQRWRKLSRSGAVSGLVRVLPGRIQRRVAERLEKVMAPTNRDFKEYFPEAELARWAKQVRSEGCRGAVLGHFHEDRTETVEGLAVRFAPQFREEGAFLVVKEDGSLEVRRASAE
jgi:UDP-2,3-diacylglucosamine hydrolase